MPHIGSKRGKQNWNVLPFLYDAAGNVLNDSNGNTPTYDAENRILTDGGATYSYDADGARIEKSSGTMYWLGSSGEVLAETDLTGTINEEYVYFGGARIARVDRPSNLVTYFFSNHLGTASATAYADQTVTGQTDYWPFGGVAFSSGTDANHFRFTGKERDNETCNPGACLDYFGARNYSFTMGRFMTPDWSEIPDSIPYADMDNPQSFNLYSYVRNSPLSNSDSDGHDCVVQSRTSVKTEIISTTPGNCEKISLGDGETKTFVPGTVTSITVNGGNSIDIAYNPSDGESSGGVTNASVAPIPDNTGLAYHWGNNAQGYRTLGTAGATMNDPRTFAMWFAASGAVGGTIAATGVVGGAGLTTLAGEDGLGLATNQALNRMIGAGQRELLRGFFKSGNLPEGLSQRSLQIYKEIAQRVIAAGKDQLGVQAQRVQMIVEAMK